MRKPTWHAQARCRPLSGKLFFTDDSRYAKAVCALCPVWEPCLDQGFGEPFGIWGGLTPSERGRLLGLRQRLTTTPADLEHAADVRTLLAAGLSLARVSVATGIEPATVTDWLRTEGAGNASRLVEAAR